MKINIPKASGTSATDLAASTEEANALSIGGPRAPDERAGAQGPTETHPPAEAGKSDPGWQGGGWRAVKWKTEDGRVQLGEVEPMNAKGSLAIDPSIGATDEGKAADES